MHLRGLEWLDKAGKVTGRCCFPGQEFGLDPKVESLGMGTQSAVPPQRGTAGNAAAQACEVFGSDQPRPPKAAEQPK